LIVIPDGGTVVPEEGGMLGKSWITLDRVTDYTKQPDGSWHADLRVPRLHVQGDSPNDCRSRLSAQFDALLAQWLKTAQESPRPRVLGDAEIETESTQDRRTK
jgi:hypothetical protein